MQNGSSSDKPAPTGDATVAPTQQSVFALTGKNAELITTTLLQTFHVTSIVGCDSSGTVLFANPVGSAGLRCADGSSPIGKPLHELAPIEWANERQRFLNLAIKRQRKLYVLETLVGYSLCTTILPIKLTEENDFSGIPADKDGDHWILVLAIESATPLTIQWMREKYAPEDIIDAQVVDLGPLSVLSPRELEVAALMGEGLRQKQIAELLHRSVSTIDRHRERIGEKLGITDRVQLIALAREAALTVEHAKKTQVSFEQHRLSTQKPENT